MLSIYAPTEYHSRLKDIINREERLDELVAIIDHLKERPIPSADNLIIRKGEIGILIDWYNIQAPYLLPENIDLTAEHLLALIFARLNNFEKVHEYLQPSNPTLLLELDFINRLQQGIPVSPEELVSQYSPFEEYRLMHNHAILRHYAAASGSFNLDQTMYFYSEALEIAPNEEYRAFTAKHLATLLIDVGQPENSARLMEAALQTGLSKEAILELQQTLCQAWIQQLTIPYDRALLEKLKSTLWKVLQSYEKQNRTRETALLLLDAGIVANYDESWSESLGYFNQAIQLFEKEELPEFAANAQYRKGILLFTWAKKGNPQFFRAAAETFQEAVKVFTRMEAPEVYADIQHHLGMIYAEIPAEQKKKSIWAAVSSTAFQEALEIYTKEHYPYEYATVCNHYGNALTKYPKARLSDNFEKAIFYYQEALRIRTPQSYPMERCLTLLNYLEAQWFLGMPEDHFDEARFTDMIQKANEVLSLTDDTDLTNEAKRHLEQLSKLKAAYA